MNSDDIHDDDRLDAFLKGEDALSQRLRALPQDEPPAALDAAILARARQAVEAARPPAANDPAPAGWRPASSRWRVPAGLAAMLLAGVLTHRTWQETNQMEQVDAPAVQPQPQPPRAEPAAPAPAAPAVSQAKPVARPKPAAKEQVVEADIVEPAPAPPPPPFIPPVETAAPTPAPAAPPPPGSVISNAANVKPQMRMQDEVTRMAPPAPFRLAPAPPPAPQPPPTPEAWLGRIEEALAAGRMGDALTQWDAFRAAYPDQAVDPALEEKISALRRR